MRIGILAAALAAAITVSPAMAGPSVAKLKAEAAAKVDAQAKLAQQIVDTVFSFGELGY